jgi:molybdenum cofactor synthesis domain-containing protein
MEQAARIEIFAIGTELVLGRIQDTNSYWMAGRIADLGGQVRRVTQLADDLEEIVAAFRESLARGTRILIACGGLGPTPDDLTVEAVAQLVGRETAVHEPTLADYMRRRNLKSREELTPNLLKMATVPEGAEVFQNPAGWAPCSLMAAGEATVIILPGPPKEMEAVFSLYVADFLSARTGAKSAALRVAVNMFESEVSPVLQEVMARLPNTYLKAYVAMREAFEQGLPVDVVATGPTTEEAHHRLQEAVSLLSELVTARGKQMEYVGE